MPAGFFLTSYRRSSQIPRGRQCAINQFALELNSARARSKEVEIDGDQAIVHVTAPGPLLRDIGLVFPALTEGQARAAWTPLRPKPSWDEPNQRVVFRRDQMVPCKRLDRIVPRLQSQQGSADLLAMWRGVGFGLGWRVPDWIIRRMVRGEREVGSTIGASVEEVVRFLFDTRGAVFPAGTDALIDAFTRADEDPLAGGWLGPAVLSESQLQLLSNTAAGRATACNSYWNTDLFGPDTECSVEFSTIPANGELGMLMSRLVNIGASTTDGYASLWLSNTPNSQYQYYRSDNDVPTQLGVTHNQTPLLVSTDLIGHSCIGDTLQHYYDTGSGFVAITDTETDNSYTAPGRTALRFAEATGRFDDFRAGTVPRGRGFLDGRLLQRLRRVGVG